MSKLKINDNVVVCVGKDKNKKGVIIAISRKKDGVKVKGLNMFKKHIKPRRKGEAGAIQFIESFIHSSNVMPVDAISGKAYRHKEWKRNRK